ncbi:hypothetical protein, partial [Thermus scotoductus]
MATLFPFSRVAIPLGENPYAEGRKGEWRDFFQVGEENGRAQIRRDKAPSPKPYTPRNERSAVDIGIFPLFATASGELLRRGLLRHFAAHKTQKQNINKKTTKE